MKATPYISSSDAIKGISDSILAKSESNDCVVRAFATSFEISYDLAHNKVSEIFERKNKKGTRFFAIRMNFLSENNVLINRKKVTPIKNDVNLCYYVVVKGAKTLRKMTTAMFLKKYPKGTYIVVVKGHAFTIKDGVVIGNQDDALQRRKIINHAWKIG